MEQVDAILDRFRKVNEEYKETTEKLENESKELVLGGKLAGNKIFDFLYKKYLSKKENATDTLIQFEGYTNLKSELEKYRGKYILIQDTRLWIGKIAEDGDVLIVPEDGKGNIYLNTGGTCALVRSIEKGCSVVYKSKTVEKNMVLESDSVPKYRLLLENNWDTINDKLTTIVNDSGIA